MCRTRTNRSVGGERVDRGAPRRPRVVGDQRERQHPPAGVGDDADQRVGARQRSGLGPQPTRPTRVRRRCRGTGWTAFRCRRRSAAGPPADAASAGRHPRPRSTVSSRVSAVSRSSTDSPLESIRCAPPVSILAEFNSPSTALHRAVETLRLALCGSHFAGDRLRHHVVGVVHHLAQPLDQRRRLHRGDLLVAVERRGQHRRRSPGRRAARRRARDRRRARASWTAAESTLTGWVRPPSSMTASIGAMSPPSMSSGSQPGAIVGPLYALMSTCTDVTLTPLRRTWSARSLIRAAFWYQVSWPGGRRRQRRITAALEDHQPGSLVGRHHLRREPGVAVQRRAAPQRWSAPWSSTPAASARRRPAPTAGRRWRRR